MTIDYEFVDPTAEADTVRRERKAKLAQEGWLLQIDLDTVDDLVADPDSEKGPDDRRDLARRRARLRDLVQDGDPDVDWSALRDARLRYLEQRLPDLERDHARLAWLADNPDLDDQPVRVRAEQLRELAASIRSHRKERRQLLRAAGRQGG